MEPIPRAFCSTFFIPGNKCQKFVQNPDVNAPGKPYGRVWMRAENSKVHGAEDQQF